MSALPCLSKCLSVHPSSPVKPAALSLSILHSPVHDFSAAARVDLHSAGRFLQRFSARLLASLLVSQGRCMN